MGVFDPKLMAVVDPVCHVKLDKHAVKFKSAYKGKNYNFCSLSCRKKFDETSEKYVEFYSGGE